MKTIEKTRKLRKRVKLSKLDTLTNYALHICQSKIDYCDPNDEGFLLTWLKELRQWASVGYSAVKDAEIEDLIKRVDYLESKK